jgi:hypothetical protein
VSVAVPIQFEWIARYGDKSQTGRGLLSRDVKSKEDEIDEFKVAVGNLIAAAYPKRGELHLDHRMVYSCPCNQPHKLIWIWRMDLEISSGPEKNTGPPSCACHVIGLICAFNKFGIRFLRDGTVKPGFDE